MDSEFWLERWRRREIGFHLEHPNPKLIRYWSHLNLAPASRVLVPLCGKSEDLLWLARQGHRVLGVEVSSLAVEAFFAEHKLQPQRLPDGPFERWTAGPLTLLCGDFFTLDRQAAGPLEAVYDRAALVALPPALRDRYVGCITELLPHGAEMLLVTFDYPQEEMQGPPFAVGPELVEVLYGNKFSVEHLACDAILAEEPRFQERGLTALSEHVFRLRRC